MSVGLGLGLGARTSVQYYMCLYALDLLASVEMSLSSVPVAGIAVTLTSDVTTSKYTTNVGAVTYQWDFGDGSSFSATERSIQHTFDTPGNYTLSLSAINQFSTASMRTKITVLGKG